MKTPSDENDLCRWLDGEMDAAERTTFEKRLASDPVLQSEAESLRKLGQSLRSEVPAPKDIPYPDFFNSQIQMRIAQMEGGSSSSANRETAAGRGRGWLSWLLPLTATAVVAALGLVRLMRDSGPEPTVSGGTSLVLSSYVPDPRIQARSFHSDEANATVLVLDGLTSIPADRKVVGHHVHHSENDAQMAATTLFSASGEVLLVLSTDGRNQPRILERTPRG